MKAMQQLLGQPGVAAEEHAFGHLDLQTLGGNR